MTIDDLINSKHSEAAALMAQRASNVAELAALRGKSDATDADAARVRTLRADNQRIDGEVRTIDVQIARYQAEKADDVARDGSASQVRDAAPSPSQTRSYDGVARVVTADRQYRADDARTGRPTFLHDLYRSQVLHDPQAGERLARHGHEVEVDRPDVMKRAVTTSAVSGFVPPAYLTTMWAELARAGRPVADLCNKMPLPETGMTVEIPRVTTGTLTGVQASQGATIANQDLDDTLLSVPVVTIAGYTDVSRQAVERGIGVETLVLGDLAADYNSKLDAQVIAGSGSSGQHLGILNTSGITSVTYTDASPTVGELFPKLADAARQVVSQRFTGPTGIVMTPLEWGWIIGQADSTGRPLVDMNGTGQNSLGIGASPSYPGSAGTMLGLPVYLSGNVPANLGTGTDETRIIVADFRDHVLFEDDNGAPFQLRFDQPLATSLGVRLVAYGYSAFTAGRLPKATSVVAGTGLITPAL